MVHRNVVSMMIVAMATISLSYVSAAQGGAGGAASAGGTAIPASNGTYSIESEILAYKALGANSAQIAGEVNSLRGSRNLLLVPSSSTAVPSFQLWRSHMVILNNFMRQADNLLSGGDGCPAVRRAGEVAPSFSEYTTAIGQGVTALQSILSLFASSQSVNEFTGTIQDQALMLAVARNLRKSGVTVVIPDIYGPSTIAAIDPDSYPFIKILGALIGRHSELQRAYVCNAVAATAAGQIQQGEIARETDYAKLAKLGAGDGDKAQPIRDDIATQKGLLDFLRLRIGLPADDLAQINSDETDITNQGQIVGNTARTAADRNSALATIHSDDVDISNREIPVITHINLKGAQIMSLVTGIESYLAGLTGGSITLTPPSAPSNPTSPTTSTPAQGATQTGGAGAGNGNGAGAGATPGATPSQSSQSSSSSTPTIVAILQADGLAARMGFTVTADNLVSTEDLNRWEIVWLKALESGGSIINEATILGSHPYFGGGAVSGYALYQLNGDLICSANVAAYGGYVKAKRFPSFSGMDHTVRSIEIGDNCAIAKP